MMIVNTKTLDDYIKVVEWALDQGKTWYSGNEDINSDFWEDNKSNTCIVIRGDRLTYCGIEYVLDNLKSYLVNMEQFDKDTRKYFKDRLKNKFDLR